MDIIEPGYFVLCGKQANNLDLDPDYESMFDTAFSSVFDAYGNIVWTYSATYLGSSSNYYTQCEFIGEDKIGSLMFLTELNQLVFV